MAWPIRWVALSLAMECAQTQDRYIMYWIILVAVGIKHHAENSSKMRRAARRPMGRKVGRGLYHRLALPLVEHWVQPMAWPTRSAALSWASGKYIYIVPFVRMPTSNIHICREKRVKLNGA
jgi:hypothetical protein